MKVNVRRWDIWFGEQKSADDCPIARAVKRATGRHDVCVKPNCIYFFRANKYVTIPYEVTDFIYNFDWGRNVKPFSFELKLNPAQVEVKDR